MVELSNIWFYTLSTSAQVIAALLGLFAVFVVYKLQSLNSSIEDVRTVVIKILPYIANNVKDFERYGVSELEWKSDGELISIFGNLLSLMKNERDRFGVITHAIKSAIFPEKYYDFNDNTLTFYRKIVERKKEILGRLKENIVFGFLFLSFCIFELNLTESLIDFKVLLATSIGITLYFMSIAGNIYFISSK